MDARLRSPILWLVVFFGGAIFQFWRGATVDTLVYLSVALLVIVEVQERFRIPEFRAIRFTTATSTLLAGSLVFILFPTHSWPSAITYLVFIPVLLRIIWGEGSKSALISTSALRKSSKIWFVIGVLTCICELGNYIASEITHDDKSFPTLTVLIDPIVAGSVGKIVFVLMWTLIGIELLRVSAAK